MFILSWPKLSRLRILITDQNQITDPDYGSKITDPGLRIRITNLDYESGLRIWIMDPEYGLRIRIIEYMDRDKFGNDRITMD